MAFFDRLLLRIGHRRSRNARKIRFVVDVEIESGSRSQAVLTELLHRLPSTGVYLLNMELIRLREIRTVAAEVGKRVLDEFSIGWGEIGEWDCVGRMFDNLP
jgi:hypothetical protein